MDLHASNLEPSQVDAFILEQAILWMVTLQSGTADNKVWSDCLQWRAQNPLHEKAWQQLQAISGSLKNLPHPVAHAVLERKPSYSLQDRRRTFIKSIVGIAGAGTLSLLGFRYAPWQQLIADQSTGVGEQSKFALADGSNITLNTDSAVAIEFNSNIRLVKLLKGEMFITTGHENQKIKRPFIVESADGRIKALGTRFLVKQQVKATLVAVFEGAVEVQANHGSQKEIVNQGQQVSFSAKCPMKIQPVMANIDAWVDGVLVANNLRLEDFIADLDRYHHGKIMVDDTVADLTISGVFPLRSTQRVLETIVNTLPIYAETHTRYLTILRKL